MRTVPVAMTWEVLRRSWWALLLMPLVSVALPTFILIALRSTGTVDLNDPSMLMVQVLMLQFAMFNCGAGVYGVHAKMSRLYTYPARTTELVAWRMLPMMLLITLQVAVSVWILNRTLGIEWAIWGPAVFAAVALAAVMAVAWLAEQSVGWLIVGLAMVAATLGVWFQSRFGVAFSNPTHSWQQVTAGELFAMLAMTILFYGVAVFAVARNRRGEPPISIGIGEWIQRVFELAFTENVQFETPLQAQCWLTWRRNGWVMPFLAGAAIFVGLIIWSFTSRNAEDLFQAIYVGGYSLAVFGFAGALLFGNTALNESTYIMGHFQATRPLSDSDMGRAILRNVAKSVALTWSIWFVAFLLICACLAATGNWEAVKLPKGMSWWSLPATFLSPWAVTGILMSLFLVGQPSFVVRLAFMTPFVFIASTVASQFLLSPDGQKIVHEVLLAATLILLLVVSAWAYLAAYRRQLVTKTTLYAAILVWLAATVGICVALPSPPAPRLSVWPVYLLVAAGCAVVVVPIASVPLALSLNRHR